mmetsp:Transcript_45174/g.51902  ORF Transcript_45174/g.51902 Transcript_45174/m.51902 type:complete len:173 (-) Transcript_45174:83-601(-)
MHTVGCDIFVVKKGYNPYVENVGDYKVDNLVMEISIYCGGQVVAVEGLPDDQRIEFTVSGASGDTCVFWDSGVRTWSAEGCTGVKNGDVMTCSCKHLTEFSVGTDNTPFLREGGTAEGDLPTWVVLMIAVVVALIVVVVSIYAAQSSYGGGGQGNSSSLNKTYAMVRGGRKV